MLHLFADGSFSAGSQPAGSQSTASQLAASQPSSLMLISSGGIAKRISAEALERSLPVSASACPAPQDVFQLPAGDSLAAAFPCSDEDEIMAVTSGGMAFRANASEIPLKSLKAAGVIGMKLKAEDAVVGAGSFKGGSQAEESIVFVICDEASAKAVFTDEFPSQKRGGMGVQLVPSGSPKVLAAFVGEDTLCATKNDAMLFPLEVAKRTHKPRTTDVQITHIGFPRWSM